MAKIKAKKGILEKIKKFDILIVPIEVEYLFPVRGRIFAALAWMLLIRLKKIGLTWAGYDKPFFSFWRLIVPRFVEGGGADEE